MTVKPIPFAATLIAGLCLGAAGSELAEHHVPMTERFLDFYETACLKPLETGRFPDHDHLLRVQITRRDVDFLHPRHGFSVSYSPHGCYVSDPLRHFSFERDRETFERALEQLHDSYAPELPRDPGMDPEWSVGWMTGPIGRPGRWGISMMFGGGFPDPLLSIAYPANGPTPPARLIR